MTRIREKKYVVAIPIPYVDREQKKLAVSQVEKWTRLALKELTECFEGATVFPALGTNILEGEIVFEEGQVLVKAACDDRDAFLARRDRIRAFAERMARALNQHSVFVLGCPSDSFLIEP
jgi:hypothetical protein